MSKNELTLKIAIAVVKDNQLSNIKEFNDIKRKLIKLLNEEYKNLYFRHMFDNSQIKFNIVYDNDEELYDINNWFTLDELDNAKILSCEEVKQDYEMESQ